MSIDRKILSIDRKGFLKPMAAVHLCVIEKGLSNIREKSKDRNKNQILKKKPKRIQILNKDHGLRKNQNQRQGINLL